MARIGELQHVSVQSTSLIGCVYSASLKHAEGACKGGGLTFVVLTMKSSNPSSGAAVMQEPHSPPPAKAGGTAKHCTKPQRRRRKGKEVYLSYVIDIAGWDSYYRIRAADPKHRLGSGPFFELATLTFNGALLQPQGTPHKRLSLTLIASDDVIEEFSGPAPAAIGSLKAHEDVLEAYVLVPVGRIAALIALAASGRVKQATIGGRRLRYRSGKVHSVSIDTSPRMIEEE